MSLYQAYEFAHAAITPLRTMAQFSHQALTNPMNPFATAMTTRTAVAAIDLFINATRRYGKPSFDLPEVVIDGQTIPVIERVVWDKPFCNLLHFDRDSAALKASKQPKLLIVAPMSGHFATLLRGTVEAMLPAHEVYITDWKDARDVPLSDGRFNLSDYIDYVIEMLRFLARDGERPAVLAVCQPGVPCLAAAARMAEMNDPARPSSLILMGSPIDTRINPTEPNRLATTRPLSWFQNNVIMNVPWPHAGFMRRVYPGFLQLSGFMSMNIDRHVNAHVRQFRNLIKGDGDSAAAHRAFYDEYLAVMDLTAEFYLETIEKVFQKHQLAKGEFMHHDALVKPQLIRDTALMTIEGAKDDITGLGQTASAHGLCTALPESMKLHYEHPSVGHYGVFNGSRWRQDIQPKVAEFISAHRQKVA